MFHRINEIKIYDRGIVNIIIISNKMFFFFEVKSYGSFHKLNVDRIRYIIQYKHEEIAVYPVQFGFVKIIDFSKNIKLNNEIIGQK